MKHSDLSQVPHSVMWHKMWLVGALSAATVFALAAYAVFWGEGPRFLKQLSSAWIVSDPVWAADAAVVLGGDPILRAHAAADLYRDGLVSLVLVSNNASPQGPVRDRSDIEANRRVLLNRGVPPEAIREFGRGNRNTYEEAIALKSWAHSNPVTSFIIPTDPFFSRRVRWVFRREFAGTGIHILVHAIDDPGHPAGIWWTNPAGLGQFSEEVLKYAYYRVVYGH